MLNKEVYSLLGLCSCARKLSRGSLLIDDILHQKASFVIICEDASENTKKKISDKCQYYHVDYIISGEIDLLSHAIGKSNCVAVGILEKGFANKIKSKLGG
ncbi:MAG: ribosomal L7Ae/L30e/S12e/Gadd45 family protein [Erysipelotrichales bacterium]|nr:ribosomal L7Ae/L30e/S12e/Gadd45 family protein [Erysipelotrichales bacterium]